MENNHTEDIAGGNNHYIVKARNHEREKKNTAGGKGAYVGKGKNTRVSTGHGPTIQLLLVIQQAAIALDALERIVGRVGLLVLLVETEVVFIGLFVLELLNVSFDNDTDIWERGI